MPLGHNLKHLMDKRGVSFPELATHCGTDPQALHNLVTRDSRRSQFAPDLATFFRVPLALLLTGREADIDAFLEGRLGKIPILGGDSAPTSAHESPSLGYRVGVPVTGVVVTGEGERHEMQELGEADGRIIWPTTDPQAYAVRIFGNHLAPRCRHGEYAIVEPERLISPGDEVIAIRRDSKELLVCQFMYERDGMTYFEDINGKAHKVSVETSAISTMHFIAGFSKSSLWRSN